MSKKITIYHLYPDTMNLYGDIGNIVTLQKRCEWRGIDTGVVNVKIGDKADFSKADIIFMGGGQDSGQKMVAQDLVDKGVDMKNEIEKGMPALLVCGGFQLFGKYFQTSDGTRLPGIGLFDAYTVAGDKRFSGNIVVDITSVTADWKDLQLPVGRVALVGFENHSGRTILGSNTKPLGYVMRGYGSNGDSSYEGAVYKEAIGTYLHGSLLPKNPWLADHLIQAALYRRYGDVGPLSHMDDAVEIMAHKAAEKRAKIIKTLAL